jgi:carbonic anhydrase
MEKLVQGIIDFRKNIRPSYRETFAKLALGQSPDCLFIACSDSRVVPNLFASTDPGDLFVIRNVGNLVAPSGKDGVSTADESEAAAIEFSLLKLGVSHIIVCGHSECGAMQAILGGREKVPAPNLRAWLRHGEKALHSLSSHKKFAPDLPDHNRLSQLNVLQQIENLKSFPIIQERVASGKLKLHAWWFELANAAVFCFDPTKGQFVEIDEEIADSVLQTL